MRSNNTLIKTCVLAVALLSFAACIEVDNGLTIIANIPLQPSIAAGGACELPLPDARDGVAITIQDSGLYDIYLGEKLSSIDARAYETAHPVEGYMVHLWVANDLPPQTGLENALQGEGNVLNITHVKISYNVDDPMEPTDWGIPKLSDQTFRYSHRLEPGMMTIMSINVFPEAARRELKQSSALNLQTFRRIAARVEIYGKNSSGKTISSNTWQFNLLLCDKCMVEKYADLSAENKQLACCKVYTAAEVAGSVGSCNFFSQDAYIDCAWFDTVKNDLGCCAGVSCPGI